MRLSFRLLLTIRNWWFVHDIAWLMLRTARALAHIRETQIWSPHQLVHSRCWRRASHRALFWCVATITHTEFIHQGNLSHHPNISRFVTRILGPLASRRFWPSWPTTASRLTWVVRYMTTIEMLFFSFASPAAALPTSLLAFVPLWTELTVPHIAWSPWMISTLGRCFIIQAATQTFAQVYDIKHSMTKFNALNTDCIVGGRVLNLFLLFWRL